ncbi:MAG: MFS transporter [Rhizobiaceae bacterium]|nr:MFS transporter [Rhizobiaceae bacterium]
MDQTTTTSHSDNRLLIVLGACLTQFTTIGLLFSYGLFFKTFEAEFGWSRTLLSSCTSIAFLVMGILAIYGGRLADRYGPRIVLGVTGALGGIGYVLMAQISEPWHLVAIFGLFIGVGMSSHDVVTLSTIARWFDKRRGTMTGIVKVGTAAGQFAVPLIAAFLMIHYGWRTALVIMGISGTVILLFAAALIKNPPVAKSASNEAANANGGGFKEARRTRAFWMLCAIQFLFFPTLTTIPLHIVVHGMDLGMSAVIAATLLSTTAAASVIGRVSLGVVIDKIGGKNAYIMCLIPVIVALVSLMFITNTTLLYVVVAVYGVGHGGLFTVVSPTIAEYFGLKALGGLFGIVIFFGTIGGAVGPVFAGYVFDTTGSYFIAFATLTVLATLALVTAIMLPAPKSTGG